MDQSNDGALRGRRSFWQSKSVLRFTRSSVFGALPFSPAVGERVDLFALSQPAHLSTSSAARFGFCFPLGTENCSRKMCAFHFPGLKLLGYNQSPCGLALASLALAFVVGFVVTENGELRTENGEPAFCDL